MGSIYKSVAKGLWRRLDRFTSPPNVRRLCRMEAVATLLSLSLTYSRYLLIVLAEDLNAALILQHMRNLDVILTLFLVKCRSLPIALLCLIGVVGDHVADKYLAFTNNGVLAKYR
eukprot:scaffold135576_cov19-Prasinocladus_malaysianus.AAC.1